MKVNNVILKTVTRTASFVIFAFSIYIFLAGHNSPGGGFIGGLMTSAAIVLLYLTYDVESIKAVLPIDYTKMIASGIGIAVLTGLASFLFDVPFLTHTFGFFDLPLFGEGTELATALAFDLGVYLTVVGVTMTIILSIGEDED